MSSPVEAAGFELSWSALRRRDPEALRIAEAEAHELARALAVESLASDPEATLEELADRRRHIARTAWPEAPLNDFALRSSLGGFVLARVAMTWVPSGQVGLRRQPLDRAGLLRALRQHGVDEFSARFVVGDWPGPDGAFEASEDGLDPGTMAGLAERTLTPEERDEALDQVSRSSRDVARLAACLELGRAVRRLLPVLPDDGLGAGFSASLALLATDRPERAAALIDPDDPTLRGVLLAEMVRVWTTLGDGRSPALEADLWAPGPPVDHGAEEVVSPPSSQVDPLEDYTTPIVHGDGAPAPEEDDVEDVLEIVEETVDAQALAQRGWGRPERTMVPAWWPGGPGSVDAAWSALGGYRTMARVRGGALGFSAVAPDARGAPVPADPRLTPDEDGAVTERLDVEALGAAPQLEDVAAEPFLSTARALLRVIVRAAEGEPPSVVSAGGFEWILRRSRALCLAGQGELDRAVAALGDLWSEEAPEQRWIVDRKLRYEGRTPEPADPRELRPLFASLVGDVARSLARTLSGACPDHEPEAEDTL